MGLEPVGLVGLIGVPGAIGAIILFALWRKWWVPGFIYDDMVKQRDMWMEVAIHGSSALKRTARVAEQSVRRLASNRGTTTGRQAHAPTKKTTKRPRG